MVVMWDLSLFLICISELFDFFYNKDICKEFFTGKCS